MDKTEFMEGIHLLQDNYNKKLTTEQLKLFYENLKDMPKERYLKNIKQQIQTNQFMPNIAQIKNESVRQFTNYEQRDYSRLDFSKFYVNKGVINK